MRNPAQHKECGDEKGLGFWNGRNLPVIRDERVADEAISEVAVGNWGSGFISFHFLILQGKQFRVSSHRVIRMPVIQCITMPTTNLLLKNI